MKNCVIKITNKKDPDYVKYVKDVDVKYSNPDIIKIISVGVTFDYIEMCELPLDIAILTIEWLQNSSLIDKFNDIITPILYR